MFVIIGQRADPHVTAVAERLQDDVLIVDAHQHDAVHFDPVSGALRLCGRDVSSAQISAMWWRLKWPDMSAERATTKLSREHWEFWKGEYGATLLSLPQIVGLDKTLNEPFTTFKICHKPYQLNLAHQCGFVIPRTRVSNDQEALSHFASTLGDRFIMKRLSTVMPKSGASHSHLGLAVIDRELIQHNPESVQFCPAIFQEQIGKSYEMRVNVVGDEIFATRIDSQVEGGSSVDWRRNQKNIVWEAMETPDALIAPIRRFMSASGLRAGAFDFAVSTDGRPVFFECNPEGQWLWIEKWTGQQVSAGFAAELERMASVSSRAAQALA